MSSIPVDPLPRATRSSPPVPAVQCSYVSGSLTPAVSLGPRGVMTLGVQKTIQKTSAGESKTVDPAPARLPDDFTVDKDARYAGSVIEFNKWRGFGHISMDQKGTVPGDKVFVHWKEIQTDDRVEFGLMITNDWKGWSRVRCLKAKNLTLPGGGMVNIQDAMDAESMQFVGAQNFRYTGIVKFFDQFRGFGWVAIDDGFAMEDPVPKEIKVDAVELNTGGKPLRMRIDKLAIEFGIIKGKNGEFLAYNVTLPGGTPITQEAMEHRQEEGGQRYSGTIQWWHRWQEWGHILPDPDTTFPEAVQKKIDETAAQAAAKARSEEKGKEKLLYFRKADCDWNLRTEIGKKVTFGVYVDDKGAGAKDVAAVGGQE